MKKIVPSFLLACTAFAMPMGVSMAQDAKLAPISDYVTSDVKPWLNYPAIIEGVDIGCAEIGVGSVLRLDSLDDG
ncbi:hypothetical protein ACC754_42705, partial [Rhizobium johnstonii]